jgi:hypothetical protein
MKEMSNEEITEYTKYREVRFSNSKKFKEWLKLDNSDIFQSDLEIQILRYLAYEYVGLITVTSLISKRNYENKIVKEKSFVNQCLSTGIFEEHDILNKSTVDDDSVLEIMNKSSSNSLQPFHIYEGSRRISNPCLNVLDNSFANKSLNNLNFFKF